MELEYKWKFPEGDGISSVMADPMFEGIRAGRTEIRMDAVYYDTPDRTLGARKAGLRLRREGDASVCCLKRDRKAEGGLIAREEYEVPAESVAEAIPGLREAGLTEEECAWLAGAELEEICRVSYLRTLFLLKISEGGQQCGLELTFDVGAGSRPGASCPIREMELELKDGSEELFRCFADRLAARFHLEVQRKSKLLQAMEC